MGLSCGLWRPGLSHLLERGHFVGPDAEHLERIGPECGADGDVGGVASARDQDS